MKTNSIYPFAQTRMAAAAVLLTCAPLAYAAPAAEKKAASEDKTAEKAKETETATGRVFSYEPEVLSVILEGNTTPVRFQVNKETPYVDEEGKAVPLELIRPEIPLTVHYHTAGAKNEDMIAEKVVFTRAMVADAPNEPVSEKREKLAAETEKDQESKARQQSTAPESVSGTIFTVEQTVTLRPHGSSEPKTFVLNNSTRFVDSSGSPVSGGVLFSGVPVSVRSIPDGTRHIAQEIMVRGDLPSAQGIAGGSGGTATAGGKMANGGRNGNRNNNRGNNNNNGSVAGTDQLGTVVPIAPGQPGYVGGTQGQLPGQGGENTVGGDADTIPNLGDSAAGGTNTNQNPGNGTNTGNGNNNGTGAANGGNNGTTNPNNNGSSNGNTNGAAQPGKPNQTPSNQPNPDNKPAPANPTSPSTGGSASGNQGGGGTGGAASGSGSTSSGGNASGGSGAGAGSTGTGTGSAR